MTTLPDSEHFSQPWRIHELTADFRLEDVWALPTPGGPNGFPLLVEHFAAGTRSSESSSRLTGILFAIRLKLGELLGWDREETGLGGRVTRLSERLPADLRDGPRGPSLGSLGFVPLYLTENEFAAEIANKTVHAVMHIGWVPDPDVAGGGYRGQLAVLVKPNGLTGSVYMAAIKPFRLLLVYPQMLRRIEREWPAARRRGELARGAESEPKPLQ